MIYTERLLNIIKYPHLSEKTAINSSKKNNFIVLKVRKYATKSDIKSAVDFLFSVRSKKVNVLLTPKKKKGSKSNLGYRCSWKKAYVLLEEGYNIDLTKK